MIRYGLIGCGNIAKTHAQSVAEIDGATLVAVTDELPEKAAAIAGEFGAEALSLDGMWDWVDAVLVCLPSALHAPVTVEAARRGKHVLTEKPLDILLDPATRMVEACEAAGVKLGCISQHRFSPDIARTRAAVEAGEFGRMLGGDASVKWFRSQGYYDSAGWRGTWAMDGGGCLMNQGVHTVDMIQWIMGGVKAVQGRVHTLAHEIEVEDHAAALIEYKSGAVGTIQGSTAVYPGFAERLEIYGTKGSAVLEGDRAVSWTTKDETEQEAFGTGATKVEGTPGGPWHALHKAQIEDFTRAITEDRPPAITGREALEPLRIILAVYESSRNGGARVEL